MIKPAYSISCSAVDKVRQNCLTSVKHKAIAVPFGFYTIKVLYL